MLNLSSMRLSNARILVAGVLLLLLLAALPLVAAAGYTDVRSYSGDDAYDLAAGGSPELAVAAASERATVINEASITASTISSDVLARFHRAKPVDDPLNGALSFAEAEFYVAKYGADVVASSTRLAGGFSGDDAYDPAAGGLLALSTVTFAASQSDVAGCDTAGYAIAGGYSGDDAYDLAAGGNPDGTALTLACVSPAITTP